MQLVRRGDEAGLRRLAVTRPRSLRYLVGRLWDPDAAVAHSAAVAIGHGAAAHPSLGLDLLRRLLWTLNDEAAMNGAASLEAFAEIGYRAPEIMTPFVAPLASYAWDPWLRPGILRALGKIIAANPQARELVAAVVTPMAGNFSPSEQRTVSELVGSQKEGRPDE